VSKPAKPSKSRRRGVIVVAVVMLAAYGMGAHDIGHGAASATTTDVVVPGGSDLSTRAGWAEAFLAAAGLPLTSCNLSAVGEWEVREGGGFGNQAAYDPLNVNPPPGTDWPGHPAIGAWAFPDAATGLRYTVMTLNNGYYRPVIDALRAGNSAQAVCDAIMNSRWATSHYGWNLAASC
jgi:hypothetical protein